MGSGDLVRAVSADFRGIFQARDRWDHGRLWFWRIAWAAGAVLKDLILGGDPILDDKALGAKLTDTFIQCVYGIFERAIEAVVILDEGIRLTELARDAMPRVEHKNVRGLGVDFLARVHPGSDPIFCGRGFFLRRFD